MSDLPREVSRGRRPLHWLVCSPVAPEKAVPASSEEVILPVPSPLCTVNKDKRTRALNKPAYVGGFEGERGNCIDKCTHKTHTLLLVVSTVLHVPCHKFLQ